MRRKGNRMWNERYLADKYKKIIHDLDNENAECQINKIMKDNTAIPFNDYIKAKICGFQYCSYCFNIKYSV